MQDIKNSYKSKVDRKTLYIELPNKKIQYIEKFLTYIILMCYYLENKRGLSKIHPIIAEDNIRNLG